MQGIEWIEQRLEGTWTIAAHENGQIQTFTADPNVTSSYVMSTMTSWVSAGRRQICLDTPGYPSDSRR